MKFILKTIILSISLFSSLNAYDYGDDYDNIEVKKDINGNIILEEIEDDTSTDDYDNSSYNSYQDDSLNDDYFFGDIGYKIPFAFGFGTYMSFGRNMSFGRLISRVEYITENLSLDNDKNIDTKMTVASIGYDHKMIGDHTGGIYIGSGIDFVNLKFQKDQGLTTTNIDLKFKSIYIRMSLLFSTSDSLDIEIGYEKKNNINKISSKNHLKDSNIYNGHFFYNSFIFKF